MAKFKKFISIIALTVFTLTFLVGCGLFVLNEDRYRDQTALTVGQETVTLGEGVAYIGLDAFANTKIKSIHLGQAVYSITGAHPEETN